MTKKSRDMGFPSFREGGAVKTPMGPIRPIEASPADRSLEPFVPSGTPPEKRPADRVEQGVTLECPTCRGVPPDDKETPPCATCGGEGYRVQAVPLNVWRDANERPAE